MTFSLNDSGYYTTYVVTSPKVGVASGDANWAAISPYNSNALFGSYLGWSLTNYDMPYGWSMSPLTSSDEIRLKEDVFEKANQLKADVLLNLIEANQIWPSIRSLAFGLPEMARNWRSVRKVIKTASGSFLAWKFGVSPILQDMMAINRYLPRMREDVKRHVKGQSSRFSSFGVPIVAFVPEDVKGYYGATEVDRRYSQGICKNTPVVRYVLVVKPNDTYTSDFFKMADAFMSRFATSPASLAWEKIPFSFVVDWFVDLRGVLRSLDKVVGFSPYKVVSCTRSFSYHLESSKFWRTASPCSGSTLFDVNVGTAEYQHYERSLVSAEGSLPAWKPRFGKSQAGISAALILQQLAKTSISTRI
jgi:hypothetical protein